jgi:hypothetical protein
MLSRSAANKYHDKYHNWDAPCSICRAKHPADYPIEYLLSELRARHERSNRWVKMMARLAPQRKKMLCRHTLNLLLAVK